MRAWFEDTGPLTGPRRRRVAVFAEGNRPGMPSELHNIENPPRLIQETLEAREQTEAGAA